MSTRLLIIIIFCNTLVCNAQQVLQITDNNYMDDEPVIYDGKIAWTAIMPGTKTREIFCKLNGEIKRLTYDDIDDIEPVLSSKYIVWKRKEEALDFAYYQYHLSFYDGKEVRVLDGRFREVYIHGISGDSIFYRVLNFDNTYSYKLFNGKEIINNLYKDHDVTYNTNINLSEGKFRYLVHPEGKKGTLHLWENGTMHPLIYNEKEFKLAGWHLYFTGVFFQLYEFENKNYLSYYYDFNTKTTFLIEPPMGFYVIRTNIHENKPVYILIEENLNPLLSTHYIYYNNHVYNIGKYPFTDINKYDELEDLILPFQWKVEKNGESDNYIQLLFYKNNIFHLSDTNTYTGGMLVNNNFVHNKNNNLAWSARPHPEEKTKAKSEIYTFCFEDMCKPPKDFSAEQDIKIYFYGPGNIVKIIIQTPAKDKYIYTLYDLAGKRIAWGDFYTQYGETQFNLPVNIAHGMYIIDLQNITNKKIFKREKLFITN